MSSVSAVTPSMRLRRAAPHSVTRAVIAARTWRSRRQAASVDQARREMAHLIEAVRPDDVERAAHEYHYWHAWRAEMRYHPKRTTNQQIEGLDHLAAARRSGRGVMLSFLHHGQYEAALAAIACASQPMAVLTHPMILSDDAPIFLRQHLSVLRLGGNVAVSAAVGSGGVKQILADGHVVAIAADVPSRSRVHFLGKDRLASSGLARIAHDRRCPVVTLTAHCEAGELHLQVHEPVPARDFSTPEALMRFLLKQHESAVLAWPEGYHQPLLRWGVPALPRTTAQSD